jgi:hypothetical protein
MMACPKCKSAGKPTSEPRDGDLPQQPFRCTLCGYEWVALFDKRPLDVTWAVPDHVTRDEERREEQHVAWIRDLRHRQESHDLHVVFMQKQLAIMDTEQEYRCFLREHQKRQTEALEGMLALLRKVQEDHARDREEGP